jgi:pimeloyl-ACP methyl ester carboxylesterase
MANVLKNIAGLPGLELNVKSTFNHSRGNARCCTAARLALISFLIDEIKINQCDIKMEELVEFFRKGMFTNFDEGADRRGSYRRSILSVRMRNDENEPPLNAEVKVLDEKPPVSEKTPEFAASSKSKHTKFGDIFEYLRSGLFVNLEEASEVDIVTTPAEDKRKSLPSDVEVGMDMLTLVQFRGYPIDSHQVTTADGYILTMFNIPHGKTSTERGKYPVILQHGLLDSSFGFISNSEKQSLAYILAEAGFDVWLANNRGCRFGRKHVSLDPDDGTDIFWRFSWDEMAAYDVPAFINYVTEFTGVKRVSYIGHSQGTTQMLAAGTITDKSTLVKEALDKVDLFVALAPVCYISHLKSKELRYLANTAMLDRLFEHKKYEFLPNGMINSVAPSLARIAPSSCDLIFSSLCGPSNNLNKCRFQVYVAQTPAGTSLFNLDHWRQGVWADTFQMYDWGTEECNQQHYGKDDPPSYDLSKFKLKTAIFTGTNDYFSNPEDLARLFQELPKESIVFQNNQVKH